MHEATPTKGWRLDTDSAGAYERYLVARMFRRWAERLLAFGRVAPTERLLDAGCGTGIVARTAAAHRDATVRPTALDPNEGMLAEARRRDPEERVAWTRGALESLPFDDASFDVVLAQQVLQFVDDRRRALAEIHRVLDRGGRATLAVLRSTSFHPSYVVLADALERHVGHEAGDMMRAPFSGPDAPALRDELAESGFDDVRIEHDVLDVRFPSAQEYLRQEAASSPLAGPLGRLDDDTLVALVAELERGLAPRTDDAGIVFPMETSLVEARA